MREIFSFIFDMAIDPLGLPVEWYWEWLILGVIEFAAYIIAYRSVGNLYSDGWIYGRTAGSILHWLIRFVVFVLIWAMSYGVIWFAKLFIAHWIIIVSILGGLLTLVAIVFIATHHCKGER